MAASILYHIFPSSSFLQLAVAVILIVVNKSLSHTSQEVFRHIAEDRVPDFVLCRNCGGDVADSHDIINHLSPDALVRTNQTLFGRPETELQVLINSLGIEFQIFTTSFARCVGIGESWHQHYSWFPGYAWKLCFCSQCGSHVGWMFEPLRTATVDRNSPSNEGFYAIIRESVISETFANSLLVVPKLYRN
ncbi:protein cereblon-like isoform X2 [Athalia rosae]|uniref:protein cereblon-like isoform X2 n=1 Tax=Athalia rosae TaxID=37344 RepID=UPI0020344754|nr:protein cereblon-like isoform X2 [Athalia rosae]